MKTKNAKDARSVRRRRARDAAKTEFEKVEQSIIFWPGPLVLGANEFSHGVIASGLKIRLMPGDHRF